MGKSPRMWVILATCLFLVATAAEAGLRRDSSELIPPLYYSMQPPQVRGVYRDPVFGTIIKRLTDATSMSYDRLTPEYTQSSAYSSHCKWLLLKSNGGEWHLFDEKGNYIRQFYSMNEPRWSRSNSDVFYYLQGSVIFAYNAATDVSTTVRSFSQYSKVEFGRGQSDISDNERTTVIGDDRFVFLYDLSTDTQFPALDTLGHSFDFTSPTPDGDGFMISWLQRGSTRWAGAELFDRNGLFQRQLLNAGGHGDMGRDVDGTQVYFQSNAATSPSQPPGWGKAVVKVRLSDGLLTGLYPLAEALSMHMSARGGDGWVYVSTYDWTDPDPNVNALWYAYSNEIVRVRADGTVVERIVHHRSRAISYWLTPRAVISMDGEKLLFASDFHLNGKPSEYVDTYVIDTNTFRQTGRRGFVAE